MALRRPRRIFNSTTRPAKIRVGTGVPNAVAVGLLGALGGAALVLFAEPSELFGRAPPGPEEIKAQASQISVVDGETLRLRDTVIRLLGIAAPPHGAVCHRADGGEFDCGAASADALAVLVRDQNVACRLHGHDRVGRPLAVCEAGGHDVNRAQVDTGFARANSELPGLDRGESEARAGHRGLWAGLFDQHS